ncbi:hypothetical protein E2C01_085989 [Portunus trituberculatus]|uniref:Uncharacterized protein n=1 Tax=Portunus trituberculatus TaxID=210409 RepID=A0A5B7IZK3_PORTR|nr:hypothetical protein [Portunus trituberculatus]
MHHHRISNSLVVHARDKGHLPAWDGVKILHTGLEKKLRKTVKAAHITIEEATNHREGFVCLSRTAAKLIISTVGRPPDTGQSASSIS